MSNINVDRKDIEKLYSSMDNCITNIQKVIIKINDIYMYAGNDWNDSKYKQLGKLVNACVKELIQVRNKLNKGFEKIKILYNCILEYEKQNLLNNNQTDFHTILGQACSYVFSMGTIGLSIYRSIAALEGDISQPFDLQSINNMIQRTPNVVDRLVSNNVHLLRVEQNLQLYQFMRQIQRYDTSEITHNYDYPEHHIFIDRNE